MVFYNIRYILRKILYIIKWSIPALLTILLIIFCFFIMTSRVSAVEFTENDVNFFVPDDIYDRFISSEYYTNDYYCYIIHAFNAHYYGVYIPKADNTSLNLYYRKSNFSIYATSTFVNAKNTELDNLGPNGELIYR